jgi:cell division septal protein FtsQ
VWFSRKERNRRHQRRPHVLAVKLRSTQRRALRWRRLSLVIGIPVCLLIGLYGAWRGGEYTLEQLIEKNPAFAIHQIDVQTDGVISLEQIRRWAGVKLDDNLFALDLARVKRDLELVPNIQSVSVARVLPHCLKIRVVEREPIAQCHYPRLGAEGTADRMVYLLDAEGCLMLPLEPGHRAEPAPSDVYLPVLVGIPAQELRPGRRVESAQVHAALRLIGAFERSPLSSEVLVKEIDVGTPNALQVTTDQGGTLTFSLLDPEAQLRRWQAVHEYSLEQQKYVGWMDLSVANNVPARWLDATNPPVTPKLGKPSRNKKKHV